MQTPPARPRKREPICPRPAKGSLVRARATLVLGVLLTVLGGLPAEAQTDPRIHRGRQIAEANCAMCHAVGRFGDSPLAIAPPFRTLHERYAVEELEESLAEGVMTGHPTMPQFTFDTAQINDFIAYLKSLEK